MNISILGPRGATLDTALSIYATLAVKSFAKQLGISKLRTNIDIRIHNSLFVDKEDSQGLCECIDPRHFKIDVALYGNWLSLLAHEMVHVKQFALGEMDPGLTRWKSNRYAGNIDYWNQPWEKEARKLQHKMVEEFDQ